MEHPTFLQTVKGGSEITSIRRMQGNSNKVIKNINQKFDGT